VMSLEPLWYSTIFGIYSFSGLFLSGLAALILVSLWLERMGPLRGVLREEHLHDLGKLLFAFASFWMYIWFTQYMLIWYANIPEETAYFVRRTHGAWFALFLLNVGLNWVVPFVVLMRRDMKRRRNILALVAVIVLVGRWLDLYLVIFPGLFSRPAFPVWEIGLTAGVAGGFTLFLVRVLRRSAAAPVADPQLADSLQYET
jgi:Ni/Fe-hydrogenase subunit HybB-like protein